MEVGCRVRVNSGVDFLDGEAIVKTAPLPNVPYSRVSVEYPDAPGFLWQFERDEVTAL